MTYVRRLIWDPWNVGHILRHEVSPEEVEEVCHSDHIIRETYKGRLILIGPTVAGRLLAVVLAPEGGGAYYPVTARPASRKERRKYGEEKGGEMT
jgi:hypothetical protein